jgi:hypothetical protein
METQALSFAARFIQDSNVRQDYIQKTQAMSRELREAYEAGSISAREAAQAANEMRNEIMEMARVRSSDLGRAKAQQLKAKGLDLDDLVAKYANRKFGQDFADLARGQQDEVLLEIVESAGRANPKVNANAARLGALGRGLWVLTAVVAIYNISTAEDKVDAAAREAVNVGGGFAGGAAGGALAGVWCGPVGVIIGVVIGGVLGSIAADAAYLEATE